MTMLASGLRLGRCWRRRVLTWSARRVTGRRVSPRSACCVRASCCLTFSCPISMGLRLLSDWRGRVIRRQWFWYRLGGFPPTGGGWPVARRAGLSPRVSCQGVRFLRWFRDGLTGSAARLRQAGWAAAGLLLGLGAEWLARSGQSLAAVAADLAVGWTLIGCGLVGWSRRPQSGVGPLLALAGFAWFCGTLAGSRIGVVATVGAALLFVHRGPLCHAIIGYQTGRPSSRMSLIAVVGCYVYAAVVPLARSNVVTIGVGVLVLAVTVWGYTRAVGPDRRARVTAIAAAAVLAIPLAGGSLARLMGTGPAGDRAVLWGYEAALVLIAAGLLAGLLWGRWAQAAVTKLVVDLGGDAEAGTLRARLAHALGDRSLVIGYWLPEAGGYVDEGGNLVGLPAAGSGRAVTLVEQDGERIAALVHDAAVLNDAGLADSVALTARIALSNARLQAEVQRRVAER